MDSFHSLNDKFQGLKGKIGLFCTVLLQFKLIVNFICSFIKKKKNLRSSGLITIYTVAKNCTIFLLKVKFSSNIEMFSLKCS